MMTEMVILMTMTLDGHGGDSNDDDDMVLLMGLEMAPQNERDLPQATR